MQFKKKMVKQKQKIITNLKTVRGKVQVIDIAIGLIGLLLQNPYVIGLAVGSLFTSFGIDD